jgi:hypothetical protein
MKLGTLIDEDSLPTPPDRLKDAYESLYNHGLAIYDDSGTSTASISAFKYGGNVHISGKDDGGVKIGVDKSGSSGSVVISGKGEKGDDEIGVIIDTNKYGGSVCIYGGGKVGVSMLADEFGGSVDVFDGNDNKLK